MEVLEKVKVKNSLDDFLGTKNHRYFGSGYKRVSYSLSNYSFNSNKIEAILKVYWPTKWSHKAKAKVVPHLGSLEAFSISAQLCEIYLCTCFNFDRHQISKIWIKEFRIKAGSTPNTNPDGNFFISATCLNTLKIASTINGYESSFEIEIGSMKIILTFDHTEYEKQCISFDKLIDVISNYGQSYYTFGYRTHVQNVYNIEMQPENGFIKSNVLLENQEINEVLNCAGNYYQPCPTLVDAILIAGQLIQVLLYEIDKLTREETNNLWMREISATYLKPMETNYFSASVKLIEGKKIRRNNQIWRMANVISLIGNNEIIGKVKIAHIIND